MDQHSSLTSCLYRRALNRRFLLASDPRIRIRRKQSSTSTLSSGLSTHDATQNLIQLMGPFRQLYSWRIADSMKRFGAGLKYSIALEQRVLGLS